jgi:hypothetical protein
MQSLWLLSNFAVTMAAHNTNPIHRFDVREVA